MRQNFAGLVGMFAVLPIAVAHAQTGVDLSGYDCSHVGDGSLALSSSHIAQVINGTYTEWREYYDAANTARLVCVLQSRPRSHELAANEAKAFLAASAAVGAPNLNYAQATERQAAGDGKFHDAPPMPLPRAVEPTPGLEKSRAFNPNDYVPVRHALDQAQDTSSTPSAATSIAPVTGSAGLERQLTIGVDDRTRVPTTTSNAFPYATIGYLVVTYPSGNSFRCSGTLVSAYVVLTAGHCVHNNNEGGFIKSASFSPGQNETSFTSPTSRPFGTKSDVKYVNTTNRWTEISGPDSHPTSDYQYDVASIEFSTPFTFTSTFMPVVFNDTAGTAQNDGYPAVAQNHATEGMWQVSGAETSSSISSLRAISMKAYALDATGGQSGSPFLDPTVGALRVMGSLSYGDNLNDNAGGPWYGGTNESLVSSWIAWTPSSTTTTVTNSVSGLRVPAVFDSSQSSTQSFFRFFNTSGSAGTVDVTLASYDDGKLLATWTSPSIPPNASAQYDIATIESQATGGTIVKHGYYSASIRPHFSGDFQYVLWRPADGTISNVTECDSHVTSDPTKLMNVHSSLLSADYPETIVLQNTGSSGVSVNLGIYDAKTGTKLGTYTTGTIPANGQMIRTVDVIEAGAGVKPSSGQYHYNIEALTSFTGTMEGLVTNTKAGVITDMTSFCTLVAQ